MRRETPKINAGSMADIAFLLLIFWLVATSLKPDRGVAETLTTEEDRVKIAVPTASTDILRIKVTEDGEYEVQINGTRVLMLNDIEALLVNLKRRAGFASKLVISADYDAPYEEYVRLIKVADKYNIKVIENEIKEKEE